MNVLSIFADARKRLAARARCAAYHLAHRDVINARSRAYYAANKEDILKQKQRAYKMSHRDATNARQRAAYQQNIDVARARYREYVAKHRDALNASRRANYRRGRAVVQKPPVVEKLRPAPTPRAPADKSSKYSPYRTPYGTYSF